MIHQKYFNFLKKKYSRATFLYLILPCLPPLLAPEYKATCIQYNLMPSFQYWRVNQKKKKNATNVLPEVPRTTRTATH